MKSSINKWTASRWKLFGWRGRTEAAGACQPVHLVHGEFVWKLRETKRHKMKNKNPNIIQTKESLPFSLGFRLSENRISARTAASFIHFIYLFNHGKTWLQQIVCRPKIHNEAAAGWNCTLAGRSGVSQVGNSPTQQWHSEQEVPPASQQTNLPRDERFPLAGRFHTRGRHLLLFVLLFFQVLSFLSWGKIQECPFIYCCPPITVAGVWYTG